jgi:hypothetical protein
MPPGRHLRAPMGRPTLPHGASPASGPRAKSTRVTRGSPPAIGPFPAMRGALRRLRAQRRGGRLEAVGGLLRAAIAGACPGGRRQRRRPRQSSAGESSCLQIVSSPVGPNRPWAATSQALRRLLRTPSFGPSRARTLGGGARRLPLLGPCDAGMGRYLPSTNTLY